MDLKFFLDNNILDASRQFFREILDINVAPAVQTEIKIQEFLKDQLTDAKLLTKVIDARIIGLINTLSINGNTIVGNTELVLKNPSEDYDMLLVFGIKIDNSVHLTKTDISRITRALNRRSFNRPVVVLIRYGNLLSFSAAERGQYKRSGQKGEKIGRISILRDVLLDKIIHAGHERILLQLRINPLTVTTFKDLYDQWLEVFNISLLNKEFYNELFTWYLWAVRTVSFPNKASYEKVGSVYNSENVIRLLTRLIFCWFVKEKGLIPESLFDKDEIKKYIKDFLPDKNDSSDYYKAILQNLFFATLNTEMPKDGGKREFIDDKKKNKNTGYTEEYLDHLVYRYKEKFINPKSALDLFKNIPFLNGGLFECLDTKDFGTNEEIRIDGFSSKSKNQPTVPNILFFGHNDDLDLSSEFEDGKKFKHCKAKGIIGILNSYKFTIEENTPLEQEIALDPELLGKIFENLLASYNPETRTTARKQTGSYYTPREIVNYMVDESLIAYLKTKLSGQNKTFQELGNAQINMFGNEGKKSQLSIYIEHAENKWAGKENQLEAKLRQLLSYDTEDNPFDKDLETTNAIIAHLSECKILDPACGSGAFPMGILHKMVFALSKLDPCNKTWKLAQLEKARRDKERAEKFEDETLRESAIKNAEEKIDYIEESFSETGHELDYARKLFLIENCIFGVDIQQVAVQISKLRFFISLMVDQRVDDTKRNRNVLSLPNLETKFVAANTLIPIEKPQQLVWKDPDVEKVEKELRNIHQRIFFTRSYADKKKMKKKEHETRLMLNRLLVEKSGFTQSASDNITHWNPFDPLISAKFFDPEIMYALDTDRFGGFFNILIGNPPYIALQRLDRESKSLLQLLKYKTFESTGDIYSLFYERGQQLLNKKGVLTFITSRQWMQASYGKSLRNFLVTETNPIQLIDFGQTKIFEGTTVFVNILVFENNKNQHTLLACLIPTTYKVEHGNLTEFFEINKQVIRPVGENTWSISNTQHINEQIEKIGKPLSKWKEIEFFRGITSGLNEAFHIEENTKNILIQQDSKNSEIIKPLLRGKDIKRYGYDFENWYIINTHNGVREEGLKRIDVKKNYPFIYEHLKQWQSQLEERLDKGEHWTNLRNCAFLLEFEKPKIVWIEISDRANFTYDDKGMYLTNSAYFLTCKTDKASLKYLLAILNSKVADFYFSQKTARIAGGRMRYTKQYVEQIPVPEISFEEQKPFIELVNFILFLKKQQLTDSTDRIMSFFFEHVIDVAVAELYFKEQLYKDKFEIIKYLLNLPNSEDILSLDKIQGIYKELNNPAHPVRYAISFLKNYEPMKTIEESLNRKEP